MKTWATLPAKRKKEYTVELAAKRFVADFVLKRLEKGATISRTCSVILTDGLNDYVTDQHGRRTVCLEPLARRLVPVTTTLSTSTRAFTCRNWRMS